MLKGRSPVLRPPTPSRNAQLPPLDASPVPRSPVSPPSPARGHIGTMQSMRRSRQSLSKDWWLLTPDVSNEEEAFTPYRPAQQDVRMRRQRRPADFGAGQLSGDARNRSSHSCVTPGTSKLGGSSPQPCDTAQPEPEPSTASESRPTASRGTSVPATGTSKANQEASATAKASAVAALQRLFFEEMVKGGGDPNGAAARALRRLTEEPVAETEPLAAGGQALAVLGERPQVPRCPSPVSGRRRRPCPGVARVNRAEVAVQG